jgi:biopolymer transport protein ExbD
MVRAFRDDVSGRVDIPITPMLDMTFQLLFFLVLTFQPQSAIEGKVEFTLPAERGCDPAPGPIQLGQQELDESRETLTVVVQTYRDGVNDGHISALILRAGPGSLPVRDLNELARHLEGRRTEAGKVQVRIAADARLKYAFVMEVMDVCKQAGFDHIAFAPPPDLAVN